MKFCVDCMHYSPPIYTLLLMRQALCLHPDSQRDYVTGDFPPASFERSCPAPTACGPKGRMWYPREPKGPIVRLVNSDYVEPSA